MGKLISIAIIAVVVITWLALSDLDFGKYDRFEEALEKGIPYKVKEVIHIQYIDDITIVMYTTEPYPEEFPLANFDALAVAFFEGNDEVGWKNIGPNGWEHYDNNNMTIHVTRLLDYDGQGNLKRDYYVVYGEINNADITKIEIKTKNEDTFEEATIVTNQGKRYYFQVGKKLELLIVRGLSKEGVVIDSTFAAQIWQQSLDITG